MNTKRKSGTFAILVAVIMVFAMTPIMGGAVYADSDTEQTINGVKYTLTVDDNGNKMVSVTGCDEDLTGAVEILEAVTFDEVEYPVTSIGVNAFNGKSITSITIPAGVTSIGGHAFEGTAITSIMKWKHSTGHSHLRRNRFFRDRSSNDTMHLQGNHAQQCDFHFIKI